MMKTKIVLNPTTKDVITVRVKGRTVAAARSSSIITVPVAPVRRCICCGGPEHQTWMH